MHDETDGQGSDAGAGRAPMDRRAALARLGAGAALAWTAPTILSATAASAATVAPVCLVCNNPNIVVNGNASAGVIVPWTNGGLGFTVLDSIVIGALGVAGVIGNAFVALSAFAVGQSSTLTQTIELGTGCGGAFIDLAADLGVLLPLLGTSGAITVSIEFLDAANNPLGNGGAVDLTLNGVFTQGATALVHLASSGVIPANAVRVVVTVSSNLLSNGVLNVLSVADNITLGVGCLS